MKTLAFLALTAAALAADPAPVFPSDLTLTSGVVLHDCRAEEWHKDDVLVRYVGGPVRISYGNIAEPQRTAVLALAAGQKYLRPAARAPVPVNPVTYSGQMVVTARGAGAYKFSGVSVFAFPLKALVNFSTKLKTVELPAPIAQATTDDDGKFTLTVPAGVPHFLFCQTSRIIGHEGEFNEWRIPAGAIAHPDAVLLTQNNSSGFHHLKIAEK